MASIAASTAAASLGMSEMLGSPIKFSGATRTVPSSSTSYTFKTVALFSKKKPAPPPKKAVVTPASEELAKWYGKSSTMFCSNLFFNIV
jgi:light-harvesting complex II chlorophyll a/b binding protein 5